MPSIRRTLVVVALSLLTFLAPGSALAVERLSLSHVRQVSSQPPTLRVYLDAVDSEGEPLRGLEPEGLKATLGQNRAETLSLQPFEDTGEGIAYIFLVDISRSLTEAQFGEIRDALEAWILDFGEKDWGAVVAFGESSRLVVDFTNDWRRLRDGLDTLGPTDNLTLFHQALDDAIELSRRQDPGLPGRRVVVVLTDGLDEGSGLNLDDVVSRFREHPVPIHAIGYSRLKPESRRRKYLEVLQRLASNSGGSFFEARQTDFAQSYATMRKAIRRVWVAQISCPDCSADGQIYRLQTNLSFGSRALSRGTDVRLLPMASSSSSAAAAAAASGEEEVPAEPPLSAEISQPDDGAASPVPEEAISEQEIPEGGVPEKGQGWWQRVPWWIYALTGLLLALLVGMLSGMAGRSGSSQDDPIEEPEEAPKAVALAPDDPALREVPAIPIGLEGVGAARPRNVRLVVVRGSRKGKEYRLTFRDKAVVGARSNCECVLTDEVGISPEQFELTQGDGQVFLRNLAPSNPTRMGGHAVLQARRLRSGDLVGTSELILRVILET